MKKMCELYINGISSLIMRPTCIAEGYKCPKNTNSKCEVVTKKDKVVKIKVYAYIGATTKAICISSVEPLCASVPCVAVIKAKDAKWLKDHK